MSDARLIFDVHHPEAATKQLLDEVVFLIVHGGAAKRPDAHRLVDNLAPRVDLDPASRRPVRPMSDWSDEETDDPLVADVRNFYKVEKWTRDDTKVDSLLYAGNNLNKRARSLRRRSSIGHGSD